MSTTYYEDAERWRLPRVSVDANNNPGSLVEYDSYGRVSVEKKFSHNGQHLVVGKNDYRLFGDL
jgi:hypothetical protein